MQKTSLATIATVHSFQSSKDSRFSYYSGGTGKRVYDSISRIHIETLTGEMDSLVLGSDGNVSISLEVSTGLVHMYKLRVTGLRPGSYKVTANGFNKLFTEANSIAVDVKALNGQNVHIHKIS